MYSCSPTSSQISLKNSFGKVVFQILTKLEMTQNKNRLFGCHFETEQHFQNFFAELWFCIVHTYMVQISLQNSGGKVVFLRGVPWNPPWASTGVKVPWLKWTNKQTKTKQTNKHPFFLKINVFRPLRTKNTLCVLLQKETPFLFTHVYTNISECSPPPSRAVYFMLGTDKMHLQLQGNMWCEY